MKTSKLLFAIITILSSTLFYAQNGFIEIEVTDSISLKAISYEYTITAENSYGVVVEEDYEADENINKMKSDNKEKMALANIENFLKNNKFNYESLDKNNYNINSNKFGFNFDSNGFKVFVNSTADLKKIATELKGAEGITGTVSKVNYEDSKNYEDALIKSTIDKGKVKAQKLALSSGLTLGKIIEIKENENFMGDDFFSMIKSLQKLGKNWFQNDVESKSYSKSYIIKFKAE
jgi:hypothetical protein